MKRGDIYWAHLFPRSGSEQQGRRPVLVVSHDSFNQVPNWRSVIVVPLSTSRQQMKRGPTVVFLPEKTAGLKEASVVLAHQITTLDRSKLGEKIGTLSSHFLQEVEKAVQTAVGITIFYH